MTSEEVESALAEAEQRSAMWSALADNLAAHRAALAVAEAHVGAITRKVQTLNLEAGEKVEEEARKGLHVDASVFMIARDEGAARAAPPVWSARAVALVWGARAVSLAGPAH